MWYSHEHRSGSGDVRLIFPKELNYIAVVKYDGFLRGVRGSPNNMRAFCKP